jgi:hypothetical protein
VVTPDKIRISLDYMRDANLWSDLKTVAMTAVICVFPAMSRLYGELPEVVDERVTEIWQAKRTEKRAPVQSDGSIFVHGLAQVEASMEQGATAEVLPWIRLPSPDFASQSAPAGPEGRANRL